MMVELSVLDWEVSAIYPWITNLHPPLEVGPSDLTHLEVYRYSSLLGLGVGVGSVSLFGILVSSSKIFANFLIALSWEYPT